MTSAYYLRYGVWNAPTPAVDTIDFSKVSVIVVSPICVISHVCDDRICTDYKTDKIFEQIRKAHGEDVLFPESGSFKVQLSSCTVLNHRYEPVDSNNLKPNSTAKLKFVACTRKLPSGEKRCDLSVFDILLLDQ